MAAAWSREKEAYYGQCLGSLEGAIQALSDNSAHMRQVSFPAHLSQKQSR
jgi:hypothetical protein